MLFFVYGTLMDADLQRLVFGEAAADVWMTPGALVHAVRRVGPDGTAPALVPRIGGRVPGYFLENVDSRMAAWMAHFEGPAYLPRRWRAFDRGGKLLWPWTFAPVDPTDARSEPWDFERWRLHHKPAMCRAVRGWMIAARPGHPLALDISWRGRRALEAAARSNGDDRRPNTDPHGNAGDSSTRAAA